MAAEAAAGADPASPAAPGENPGFTGAQSRPGRTQNGRRPFRRRDPRKRENAEEVQQKKDAAPKGPEPSLQEKIAILQSKFRGIQ